MDRSLLDKLTAYSAVQEIIRFLWGPIVWRLWPLSWAELIQSRPSSLISLRLIFFYEQVSKRQGSNQVCI